MANLDDGIENLQRFCALVAETNTQVQQTTDKIEAQENDLNQLEETLEDKFGTLQTELQELRTETERAEGDATGEIERLGDAAEQAASARLGQAEQDLDESGDDIQAKLAKDQGDADKAFAELETDGFEALHGTLESVGGEVQSSQGETEQAFDTFDHDLQGHQQEFENAGDKAVQAMDQAGSGMAGEDADEFKSQVAQLVTQFTGALPQEVQSGAEQVASELETKYQAWRTAGEEEGDDLIQTVGQLADEMAQELTGDLGTQVEQGMDKATDQELGELDTDFSATNTVLEEGEGTTQELEPLPPELEISKTVVADIDRALGALE